MTLQRDEADLSILVDNLRILPDVVPDKDLLEHIYLDIVLCNKKNFIIALPFDLKKEALKVKSFAHLRAIYSKLETIVDAAERARLIFKIDDKKVTPYKLAVNKCKKEFSYTLYYFDGRLKSKDYTQKEIWHHPRLIEDYCTNLEE